MSKLRKPWRRRQIFSMNRLIASVGQLDLTWVTLESQRSAHDADLRVCDESVGSAG